MLKPILATKRLTADTTPPYNPTTWYGVDWEDRIKMEKNRKDRKGGEGDQPDVKGLPGVEQVESTKTDQFHPNQHDPETMRDRPESLPDNYEQNKQDLKDRT